MFTFYPFPSPTQPASFRFQRHQSLQPLLSSINQRHPFPQLPPSSTNQRHQPVPSFVFPFLLRSCNSSILLPFTNPTSVPAQFPPQPTNTINSCNFLIPPINQPAPLIPATFSFLPINQPAPSSPAHSFQSTNQRHQSL